MLESINNPGYTGDTLTYKEKAFRVITVTRESIAKNLLNTYGIQATDIDLNQGYLMFSQDIIYQYNIPEKFAPYALLNEVLCQNVLNEPTGACAKALEIELNLVPSELKEEYVQWRIKFFKHQENINLRGSNPKEMENFKKYGQEMKSCYEYLESL